MRVYQRCVAIACILFTIPVFIIYWMRNDIQQKLLLHKLCYEKSFASPVTRNTTCSITQSGVTSTQACTNCSYFELLRKVTRANNVTLYLTSNHTWNGRLGNQMFKYAAILGMARAQGRRMFFHPNTHLVKTFKVTYVAINESKNLWPHHGPQSFFDENMFNLPKRDIQIIGDLQSFLYFSAIMDEVRQEFTFHDSIANAATNILQGVYVKYNSSMIVGVHVRRGDFLEEKYQQRGYGVPQKSYFTKAFSLMKSKFPGRNITFLVASDDLKWCSENLLGNEVYLIPPASAEVHLAVLSKCDHMIISGGTFGWWSGWLANGYVIYFGGYMKKGTPYGNWFRKDLYYPRMWIELEN